LKPCKKNYSTDLNKNKKAFIHLWALVSFYYKASEIGWSMIVTRPTMLVKAIDNERYDQSVQKLPACVLSVVVSK
jgi:hypothetical protein